MSMGLQARQIQTQKLAPRMIQSMEILQLPTLALEERIELAGRMQEEYEMPMPVLVDTMEDQSRAYFSELPSPVFIINAQGQIQAKFPWPDVDQIRDALAANAE